MAKRIIMAKDLLILSLLLQAFFVTSCNVFSFKSAPANVSSGYQFSSMPQKVQGGSVRQINFSSLQNSRSAELEYSSDGVAFTPVATLAPTDTFYLWNVPALTETGFLRLSITQADGKVVKMQSSSFQIDSTPPAPVVWNWLVPGVTADLTNSFSISSCSDRAKIFISDSSTAPLANDAGWVACSETVAQSATFSAGDGTKTLYVFAQDDVGNVSTATSGTIDLDQTGPVASWVTAPSLVTPLRGGQSFALTWSASDTNSISEIKLYYTTDDISYTLITPASLSTDTTLSWTTPSITNSTVKLRLSVKDSVGNISHEFTSDFSINSTVPTAPVVTLSSANPTASTQAELTVSSCSSLTQVFVSESSTAPALIDSGWQSCTTTAGGISYTLSSGDGTKSLYVYGRDAVGNISSGASLSVLLNSTVAPLAWTPLVWDFSNLKTGSSSTEKVFTLSNSGTDEAIVCSTPTISNTSSFTITENNCGVSNLAGGASCTVKVKANPTTDGVKTATLSRQCFNISSGVVSTTANQITVTAVSDTTLSWSPLIKDFGNIYLGYSSTSQIFTLTNSGSTTALSCSAPALSNAADFEIVGASDSCASNNLASAGTCSVMVKGKPGVIGLRTGTLSRSCFNIATGEVKTTTNGLSVTGLTPIPDFATNYTAIDFAITRATKASFSRDVYYMNKGNGTATGCGAASLTNPSDFEIVSNECMDNNILPGEKCKVSVRAKSTLVGTRTGKIQRVCTTGGALSTDLTVKVESELIHPVKVASGRSLNCALMSNKRLKCWGNTSWGINSATPQDYTSLSDIEDLVIFGDNFCAIRTGGALSCWGSNSYGQVGNGLTSSVTTPVLVLASGVVKVGLSESHACALMADGTIKCWGSNYNLKLGLPDGSQNLLVPTTMTSFGIVKDFSVGNKGTCVVRDDKTVSCLGLAFPTNLTTVSKLFPAREAHCALLEDGSLKCWGYNDYGLLGDGTTTASHTIAKTVNFGADTVVDVVSANYRFCATLSSGSIKCWGMNSSGELGDGTRTNRYLPTTLSVVTPASVAQISFGPFDSCALMQNESIRCWGDASANMLGSGELLYQTIPQKLSSPVGVSSIIPSDSVAIYASLTDGSNVVWGSGFSFISGTHSSNIPMLIPAFQDAFSIASSNQQVCATLPGNIVSCYTASGWDTYLKPSFINTLSDVQKIAMSSSSSYCMLKTDKTVWCWGNNDYGKLGDGTNVHKLVSVDTGLTNVIDIVAGSASFCAVHEDRSAKCWGNNGMGILGQGATGGNYFSPTLMNLSNVVKISIGGNHACALLIDGTMKCWGYNSYGQLGFPGGAKFVPTVVPDLNDVMDITAASDNTCVVLSNGIVKCWGDNSYGQLGDGTTINRNTPVTSFVKLKKVFGGNGAMCGISSDDTASCWGNDGGLQLGDYVRPPMARTVSGF